jgi:hypothetical protein
MHCNCEISIKLRQRRSGAGMLSAGSASALIGPPPGGLERDDHHLTCQ